MKLLIKRLVIAIWALSIPAAHAQGPHEFSGNVAITTEYMFRGISQSNEDPALQGGLDYLFSPEGAPVSLYLGLWASNIEFNAARVGQADDASLEIDFYGGLSGDFGNGIGWDIGGLFYYYPGTDEDIGAEYNYWEGYGSLSYFFSDVVLEPAITTGFAVSPDYFGEDGTGVYGHGSADITLPWYEIGISGLIGYLDVEGDVTTGASDGYSYLHWQVGVNKNVFGFDLDLSYLDASDGCHEDLGINEDLCEGFVFTVSRSL